MLMDDIMEYGTSTGNARRDRERDRSIRNKCQADLVYYAVLQEMLRDYGIDLAKRMQDIEPDALCIARDQMAMLASDDGLLQYGKVLDARGRATNVSNDRVTGFYNPGTGRFDPEFTEGSLTHFVRETFKNSEALRAMVSTHLASSPAYIGTSMTDEELEELVDREFEERVLNTDRTDSPISRVLEHARSFNRTIGLDGGYFSAGIPGERVVRDDADAAELKAADAALRSRTPSDGTFRSVRPGSSVESIEPGSRILDLDANGRPSVVQGLKLSPLMPEFRTLRLSGDGMKLGLLDGNHSNPMMNSLMAYNPQKRLLHPALQAGQSFEEDYLQISDKDMVSSGILFGPSEYMTQEYHGTKVRTHIEDTDENVGANMNIVTDGVDRYQATLYDPSEQNSDLKEIHAWKMAEVLRKHSGQSLTDSDYATIRRIMQRSSRGTLFGDPSRDGEGTVRANADAYFDYLDHVCATVREGMSSHEFGIHFSEREYFEDRNGLVPLLYFTGERTDDYNRARANNARYFGIYPFADYTPANLDVSPIAGDIAPAAYNSYTVTDVSHRRSDADMSMNQPHRNRFAHSTYMDRQMVASMRSLFDSYVNGPDMGRVNDGLRLVKIKRKVGDTGHADLSEFIAPDGSVDAGSLVHSLIDDMNRTKGLHREAFLDPSNREHMKNILDLFKERQKADTIGGAMGLFYDNTKAKSVEGFVAGLSKELESCMELELRGSYGQDINTYAAMRHTYRCYLEAFVNKAEDDLVKDAANMQWTGKGNNRRALPDLADASESFRKEDYDALLARMLRAMADPNDATLDRAMRDMFGYGEHERNGYADPDEAQKVILKGNMLRYSSSQFMHNDYGDLMKLLSYTNAVSYEPDPAKPGSEVMEGLSGNAYVAVQLYTDAAYPMHRPFKEPEPEAEPVPGQPAAGSETDDVDDDVIDEAAPDATVSENGLESSMEDRVAEILGNTENSDGNDEDDDVSEYKPLRDDRGWFDAVFADADAPGHTYAWADMDPDDYADDRDAEAHAVFFATHPLQYAALMRCGEVLSRTERGFDGSRLSISEQGMISYLDREGAPVLKIGPVIDEEAYIRPVVEDTTADDPLGQDITRTVHNEYGFPVLNDDGSVVTEEARVRVNDAVLLDYDGSLKNEVVFGPLDRRSSLSGPDKENAINNRYYGISAKVAPYSGYDHEGQSYVDRMSFSTYQMSVMNGIDRCLALHLAAHNGGLETGIAKSLFYTNVSAVSLEKCYQTNTYLMDNKAKSVVAGRYMANYVQRGAGNADIYPGGSMAGDGEEIVDRMVSLHMAQMDAYRNRVVMPKISLDQNIGVYNQALNLHQCWVYNHVGNLDVDIMRNSDSKSPRVAPFGWNLTLDSLNIGSAKNLGSSGHLTNAVRLDRITGRLEVDPETIARVQAGERPETRMSFVSQGAEEFATGAVHNFVEHPGGQAPDRHQLSNNGNVKSVNIAYDMKYAMISLGYDMEDGYIVSKKAAHQLGHFEEDGTYKDLVRGDKVGETESGNKGIVSEVVDTDIGAGLDDEAADAAFRAQFLFDYIASERINHGGADPEKNPFWAGLQDAIERQYGTEPEGGDGRVDMKEWFMGLTCGSTYGTPVRTLMCELQMVTGAKASRKKSNELRAEMLREDIHKAVDPYLSVLCQDMLEHNCQPFTGNYRPKHDCWQLFRDNPELDAAMTNVCVCTRSNPSILMNIGEALDRDNEGLEKARRACEDAGEAFDEEGWLAENGESVIVLRNADGSKRYEMGASGRFDMYVDNHTADDKNKDYNQNTKSTKQGRRFGAQEAYALQARKCCDDFYAFMMANDPALPDNLAKLNRKVAMSGFLFDLNKENMACRTISEMLEGAEAKVPEDGDGSVLRSDAFHGTDFVDMSVLAKSIASQVKNGSQKDIEAAVGAMAEDMDFSKLFSLKYAKTDSVQVTSKSTEDMLHYMFRSAFGQKGGAMMVLPESMTGVDLRTDIGLRHSIREADGSFTEVVDWSQLSGEVKMPDGSERTACPLFVSSKEVADSNAEAEMVTAPVDDRLQFKLFKAALAGAVADELYKADLIPAEDGHDRVPKISENVRDAACVKLSDALKDGYKKVPKEKSLSLDDMNDWMKKNLYYMALQDSLTCVWRGDPAIGIGEAGISFEKAKSLGLLRERQDVIQAREDLPDAKAKVKEIEESLKEEGLERKKKKELEDELQKAKDNETALWMKANVPDTYEFMADKYEPLGEDDIILVNRSPGQTTGCVRAFRARIICEKDDGLAINPADATIFDGDFDGDTVGVSKFDAARGLDPESTAYKLLSAAAKAELMECMSMQGNMVHEADYCELSLPDGSEVASVHPLFIAGNADYAVAKYNMMQADANGEPACGYNVKRELDAVTAMSNMLYELRNSVHDFYNGADGRITTSGANRIVDARMEQIQALTGFFEGADGSGNASDEAKAFWAEGTERDKKDAEFWSGVAKEFRTALTDFRKDDAFGNHTRTLDAVTALDAKVFARMSAVYSDMGGHITTDPKLTHGRSHHEILDNIVKDANITKKGKVPQLNAILSYSSVGKDCEGGRLSVEKNKAGKFELMVDGKPKTGFDESIKMTHTKAVSDVPKSKILSQIENHSVAQSDKADATGLGGAMAQKMQKTFSCAGYGGLGLRISGPITQSYLDAKQNVTKCGNNLKIGKSILDSIAKGVKYKEFTKEAMAGADMTQVFRGQYNQCMRKDRKGKLVPEYMTVTEYVDQLDNFIQVMGHPGLTKIDRAVAESVMSNYAEEIEGYEKPVVKDPIRKADRTGDMTFAIMYGSSKGFPSMLAHMAESGKGPFDGSFGFDGRVDAELIRERMDAKESRNVTEDADRIFAYRDKDPEQEPESVGLSGMGQEDAAALIREKSGAIQNRLDCEQMSQAEADKVLSKHIDPEAVGGRKRSEAYIKRTYGTKEDGSGDGTKSAKNTEAERLMGMFNGLV